MCLMSQLTFGVTMHAHNFSSLPCIYLYKACILCPEVQENIVPTFVRSAEAIVGVCVCVMCNGSQLKNRGQT